MRKFYLIAVIIFVSVSSWAQGNSFNIVEVELKDSVLVREISNFIKNELEKQILVDFRKENGPGYGYYILRSNFSPDHKKSFTLTFRSGASFHEEEAESFWYPLFYTFIHGQLVVIRDERIQWELGDFQITNKSKRNLYKIVEKALPKAVKIDFPVDPDDPNSKTKKIKLRPYQVQNIVCNKLKITFYYDGTVGSEISGCPN